jgi:hypothetical protein
LYAYGKSVVLRKFIGMKRFSNFIKEPIVLFVLLGAFIFLMYTRASAYIDQKNRQVHVSQTQIAILAESFQKTWGRSPTAEELRAQVDNFIMDEIFFKEAVAMGLDKTDPSVKRRLRQMMEMMMDDFATIYPTETQLREYLTENPEKFRQDSRISFRHIYFPMEDKEGAEQLLGRLQQGIPAEIDYPGGLSLIPDQLENESEREVGSLFGEVFTREVFRLETGTWSGPIASSYGWHLVRVSDRIEGEIPDLNEIWDLVEREWTVKRKMEVKEQQYKAMRDHYWITIEEIR